MTDKIKEYHIEERDLWLKLPHLHKWWNKLYLAETMGYKCGPGGTAIPETREYDFELFEPVIADQEFDKLLHQINQIIDAN